MKFRAEDIRELGDGVSGAACGCRWRLVPGSRAHFIAICAHHAAQLATEGADAVARVEITGRE